MKLLAEAFGIVLGVGAIFWTAAIFAAETENKAVVICKPVHYAVTGIGYVTTAATSNTEHEESAKGNWQDWARLKCLRGVDAVISASKQ